VARSAVISRGLERTTSYCSGVILSLSLRCFGIRATIHVQTRENLEISEDFRNFGILYSFLNSLSLMKLVEIFFSTSIFSKVTLQKGRSIRKW